MITEFLTADCEIISSLRCGGKLHRLIAPTNVRELTDFCRDRQKGNYIIVGGLTNTLVLSGGVTDIAVTCANMRGVTVEGTVMKAFCGEKTSAVSRVARMYGLTGMESFFGLPGTVGGAVRGNAGCFGTEIADILIGMDIVDLWTGEREYLPAEEIAFGYRYSNLRPNRDFLYRAHFDLHKGNYDTIVQKMKDVVKERKEHQPPHPSLGSVFKRYANTSAGWYIEQVGLKGYRYGGMEISDKHANFIVNRGGTAEDYLHLMELAERKVYETFGIKLLREVKVIGEQSL